MLEQPLGAKQRRWRRCTCLLLLLLAPAPAGCSAPRTGPRRLQQSAGGGGEGGCKPSFCQVFCWRVCSAPACSHSVPAADAVPSIPTVKGSGTITATAIMKDYLKNLTASSDISVIYTFDNVGDTQGEWQPPPGLGHASAVGKLPALLHVRPVINSLHVMWHRPGELYRKDI